jgi:hypothetical protein
MLLEALNTAGIKDEPRETRAKEDLQWLYGSGTGSVTNLLRSDDVRAKWTIGRDGPAYLEGYSQPMYYSCGSI